MSRVAVVLLVPRDGDLQGLLKEGVCGSRPPVAVELSRGTWWGNGDPLALDGKPVEGWEVQHGRRGLVLAWGGAAVPEGRGWLVGRLVANDYDIHVEVGALLDSKITRSRWLETLTGCTLVLLDPKWRQINAG